ncbi:hypothetical protein ACMBCM_08490, partial [Spiroplasma sp. K1]
NRKKKCVFIKTYTSHILGTIMFLFFSFFNSFNSRIYSYYYYYYYYLNKPQIHLKKVKWVNFTIYSKIWINF